MYTNANSITSADQVDSRSIMRSLLEVRKRIGFLPQRMLITVKEFEGLRAAIPVEPSRSVPLERLYGIPLVICQTPFEAASELGRAILGNVRTAYTPAVMDLAMAWGPAVPPKPRRIWWKPWTWFRK